MEDLKYGCFEHVITIALSTTTLLRLLILLLILGLLGVCSTTLSHLVYGTIYFLYLLVFFFSVAVTKYLTKTNYREKRFILAHSAWGSQSTVCCCLKVWQQKHREVGHSTLRTRGKLIHHFLLCIQSRTSGHEMMFPEFQVSLPTSVLSHFESLH